jgi:hypothetical protein
LSNHQVIRGCEGKLAPGAVPNQIAATTLGTAAFVETSGEGMAATTTSVGTAGLRLIVGADTDTDCDTDTNTNTDTSRNQI